jgi:hypothetical protein
MNILNYIYSHATEIVAIIGGFHILAVAIVKLTPTPKDDAILAKVLPVIEKFASFLSVKAKADETK